MEWSDSVRTIKGIGEKAEQCLSKLGIVSVGDMLEHYPRRYDEWKDIVPVSQLEEGEISAIEGTLTARPQMKVH